MSPNDPTEIQLREREVIAKEREQATREEELKLKRKEHAVNKWINPLVVAILAAAVAGAANATVAFFNGRFQRELEAQKADQSRVLEMLKTEGDVELAARNLRFLLDAGLISDADLKQKLERFLGARKPGSGPSTVSSSLGALGAPIIGNARLYLLTGRKSGEEDLELLRSELRTSGYVVLGAKYLVDVGRPARPEIRYFNASDKSQASVLAEFMRFRLNANEFLAVEYRDTSAKPGYIEIWLGR